LHATCLNNLSWTVYIKHTRHKSTSAVTCLLSYVVIGELCAWFTQYTQVVSRLLETVLGKSCVVYTWPLLALYSWVLFSHIIKYAPVITGYKISNSLFSWHEHLGACLVQFSWYFEIQYIKYTDSYNCKIIRCYEKRIWYCATYNSAFYITINLSQFIKLTVLHLQACCRIFKVIILFKQLISWSSSNFINKNIIEYPTNIRLCTWVSMVYTLETIINTIIIWKIFFLTVLTTSGHLLLV
jgi:hypothetical protein